MLHRIGADGILIAADFSTYTADPKALKIVLAQLRRIYDGNYSREFGTDENLDEREWHGRLTLLGGAVPDVDRHYQLFQSLGERFVRVRWKRAGGVEAGLRAMTHTHELGVELRNAVHSVLRPILAQEAKILVPSLTDPMLERISALSELTVLGRSHVERDRIKRSEIVDVPVTEGNTRLPQQLSQIARGTALLDGRESVGEGDFKLVARAAFDSMPPARRVALVTLMRGKSPYSIGVPSSVVNYALGDLQAVGVVEGVGQNTATRLTGSATRLIEQAGITVDLLSHECI